MENASLSADRRWVIKLGGSLLSAPDWPDRFRSWHRSSGISMADVVVGGGSKVETLREQAREHRWNDSQAHWRAIEAMDENAVDVAALGNLPLFEPSASCVGTPWAAPLSNPAAGWRILKLSKLLQRLDPLPHGWDITSDSISAWWARYSGAEGLILLKSRPARRGWDPRCDDDQGLVDPCFRHWLPPGIEVRVVAQWDSPPDANLRAPLPRV